MSIGPPQPPGELVRRCVRRRPGAVRAAAATAAIVGVRARPLAVVAAAVALALVVSSVARADAVVSHSAGQLTVTVEALAGADGNHGIVVEPFTENRFRVRQDQFGRPQFNATGTCDDRFFENDIVCNGGGGRTSARITTGDGDDVVVALADLRGYFDQEALFAVSIVLIVTVVGAPLGIVLLVSNPTIEPPCVFGTPPVLPVTVSLGAGSDTVAALPVRDCPAGSFVEGSFLARLIADGGSGADRLVGGARNDDLSGGAGVDQLLGGDGDDFLRGSGDGDRIDGGPGVDTVAYNDQPAGTNPVAVTIGNGQNDDGPVPNVGGTDNVEGTVENVIGGFLPDSLFGNDSDNTLTGLDGGDTLRGRGGDDTLVGLLGNDELHGEAGADTLRGGEDNDTLFDVAAPRGPSASDTFVGGAGDDTITSRDGVFDTISCGRGTDSVEGDLADFFVPTGTPLVPTFSTKRNGNAQDCEDIDAMAIDDGPPGRAVGRTLRLRAGGTATVTISCPRRARVACRGTLTARLGRPRGPVVGRAGYSARLGRRTSVTLRLGGRPRGTRIFLETLERGVSKRGPRSAVRVLTVR